MISQNGRDLFLLRPIAAYLDYGSIQSFSSGRAIFEFRVSGLETNTLKIIPLFLTYKLCGVKAMDF
jgi:LAGLIDADG endonuclease